jgi:hypothetical protein
MKRFLPRGFVFAAMVGCSGYCQDSSIEMQHLGK